jgi:hypothetical protein
MASQTVKPVDAESIDKTFSDSIGVLLDNTCVAYKIS